VRTKAAFGDSWERNSLNWRNSDCWAATPEGSVTGLIIPWEDAIELLRSGEGWALSWAGFPMVASVSACMTGLNMAITWLAMADTIAESGGERGEAYLTIGKRVSKLVVS